VNIIDNCRAIAAVVLLAWLPSAWPADGMQDAIAELQHGWTKVLYQSPADKKDATYRELSSRAQHVVEQFPGQVEPMIWEAIVLSSYAEYQNGLGALGKLKKARALLLAAQEKDTAALNATIPMVLGVIHYKAPGWPLSFGDKRKAREYLQAALRINPEGIDENFYYGDFLLRQDNPVNARIYLQKALDAAPRAGREDADHGRRSEIEQLLQSMAQR
jgi:tetratricopeptide (TPR) repeat protein